MTEDTIFTIILHAGNARSEAYDALRAAQAGNFAAASSHLQQAEAEIAIAHRAQSDTIQQEAGGQQCTITLLAVHAQDHLMTAVAEKSLIENMIEMHKTIRDLAVKLEACSCHR